MPAVRKEGLYFNNTPRESFPSREVQEILSPLHALGLQCGKDTGGEMLLAFPIMAYEIVNDLATHERPFVYLYRHFPVLSSRLLAASTEFLAQSHASWGMRRALLHWSNEVIWVQPARSSSPTVRLADFKMLRDIIHQNCPKLRGINADLIRAGFTWHFNASSDKGRKGPPELSAEETWIRPAKAGAVLRPLNASTLIPRFNVPP